MKDKVDMEQDIIDVLEELQLGLDGASYELVKTIRRKVRKLLRRMDNERKATCNT